MKMVKSLKSKLIFIMISLVTACVLLLGSISIWLNYDSTIKNLEQTMMQTANISAERIAYELKSYLNVVSELGATARLLNPSISLEEKQELVDEKVRTYGFDRANMIDKNGVSIFNGIDYSDREYFQRSMQGETYITQPMIAKSTGTLSIIISAPVWKDGIPNTTVEGVVYVVPTETFLNDIVKSIKISANGAAYIINAHGGTVAHYNNDMVLNENNTIQNSASDPSLKDIADLEREMIAGKIGFGTYRYQGASKFLAYAPIDNTDGWSIGINAPTSDFLSQTVQNIIITIVLLIISIIIASIIAVFMGNRIANPIRICAARLSQLAEGDLKTPVPAFSSQDEIEVLSRSTGDLVGGLSDIVQDMTFVLGEMSRGNMAVSSTKSYTGDFIPIQTATQKIIASLNNILHQIDQSAEQVSGGSEQVSAGAQALSQGATEQASSIEELASSITDISDQIQRNAGDTRTVNGKVELVGNEINTSNDKMKLMIQAMSEISESSSQIQKIMKTVEDIAFQTNILALNAAVEAARAGQAGKGFAVVAGEVGNLASKSAEASKNTAALIENSIAAVEKGTRIADETAQSLVSVVAGTGEIISTIERISDACASQATAISQVTLGIEQISSVVQTNSATAEESAASSEQLSSQAKMLKDLVGQFELSV